MNKNFICVFDFETDSSDPNSELCNPVELSAKMVHPRTLQVVPNSEFSKLIRPEGIEDREKYIKDHKSTLDWHCKKDKVSVNELLDKWEGAPDQKTVFEKFKEYLLQYNSKQERRTQYSAPIAAGHNIVKFDLLIMDRICSKLGMVTSRGNNNLFHNRDVIDSMHLMFYWFESNPDVKSYSFDFIREYFNLDAEGAHSADVDVDQTADLIMRFLKLHRRCLEKVKFR